ncbi:MAG: trimeric intracellular cation channel family protein [Candidatus Nanopelagicales bacterium]
MSIFTLLDLASIAIGALFGSAIASKQKAPIVGVILLSVITALGGGMLRDVLLDTDVLALTNAWYLPVAVASGLLMVPFAEKITAHSTVGLTLDAAALSMFVLVGTEKAISLDQTASAAILIGVITAIGGGTLANLMQGKKPIFLERGPWYASAAVLGAVYYVVADQWLGDSELRISAVALVFALTFFSGKFGWNAPALNK